VGKQGFQSIAPGHGVLDDEVRQARTKMIPIEDGIAIFSKRIQIPVQPHVGTIGGRTREERVDDLLSRGSRREPRHEGRFRKATPSICPCSSPAHNWPWEIIHALMADGEVCVTGIEIAGTIRTQVDVVRGLALNRPLVEPRNPG